MKVRPTALLVVGEVQELRGDSGPPSPSRFLFSRAPCLSHRPELYTTVVLLATMPIGR